MITLNYATCKTDYFWSVNFYEKTAILTQIPYPNEEIGNNIWEAHAEDAEGNSWMVQWEFNVDQDVVDYNWEKPIRVKKIE